MTRILAISHYYAVKNRGGGEIYLHNILKEFVSRGFQVDAVATRTEADNETFEGVNVYYGIEETMRLTAGYDLVITQFENAPNVIDACKRLKIPCVYIVHNNIQKTKDILSAHKPDLAIFNTNWVRDDHNYKGRSIVVHPIVDPNQHRTTPGNNITLVNLLEGKGANVFYNLATRLPTQRFLGVKGGYFKDQQIILKRPNVKIIESTLDMKNDVWAKTRILLMPSTYETYGMVGVEAMASGIPVIASPTPGLKESLSYAGIFPKDNTLGSWVTEIRKLQNDFTYSQASALALQRSQEIDPKPEIDILMKEVDRLL